MNTFHRTLHLRLQVAAVALLVAVAVSLLTACGNRPTDGRLRIAYLPVTHSLPLFAMNELPDSLRCCPGVELVKFSSWTELTDALNSGCIDGAVLLTEIAVRAREYGVPLTAVALGHHDGNVLVAASDIADASQLKGKTIAIPHRLSSHNLLLNMVLQKHGLTIADVHVAELPPPEMPAALAEKRIAAFIVAEPFGAKAIVQGVGKVLYTSPEVWPHSVCCTLVLREEATVGQRQNTAALIHDYRLAADSLTRSLDWQLQVAGKYLTVPKEVLRQSQEWIDYADLRVCPAEYDTLTHWMNRLGLSRKAPAFSEFADTALWHEADDF